MKRLFFILMVLTAAVKPLKAQDLVLKTNLLADAFLNVNAGVEMGLAPKWTFEIVGQLNTWELSHNRNWKHWALQPELRYWFCDRFSGHFVGIHTHVGQFNVGGIDTDFSLFNTDFSKLRDSRYQGWFVGAGVAYGYSWILNRHWNLEGEIGLGYSYTTYDKFRCAGCGKKTAEDQTHHYVGVTRAAVNLIYAF